ncbi:pirin family protein [Kitasatospora sp. NPDC056531]|uniref:pirin family protein n=1 Tax=Kitasatospora sp. NPDC056531 TaxID=3345856 RepID=UPI0036CFB127
MSTAETEPRPAAQPQDPQVEVLTARDVPLGGPRAMTVRRTLPHRSRRMIGAWCFVDHYGPDDVARTGGMDVAPHPHTGLQTVSWLFTGEIEHRDSLGVHAFVRPGELNLMTSGHGICHSEVSTPATTVLHGVQLWVALPDEHRHTARDFHHHVPRPVPLDGGEARVLLGTLAGDTSPVPTFTPLLGAEACSRARPGPARPPRLTCRSPSRCVPPRTELRVVQVLLPPLATSGHPPPRPCGLGKGGGGRRLAEGGDLQRHRTHTSTAGAGGGCARQVRSRHPRTGPTRPAALR